MSHERLISGEEMRELVRKFRNEHATLSQAAAALDISPQAFCEILAGRAHPNNDVAAQFGFERVIAYRHGRKPPRKS